MQSNVYATITANGNTYNTNTSTVSYTAPSYSINGSSSICSGTSSYTVDGLPCNSTVVWSVTPGGIVNPSQNGNEVTLTKTGVGVITLTATVTNACATATLPPKPISVGVPAVTITGPSSICPCTCCNYYTATNIPGATYTWSISPASGNSVSGTGNQAEVIITSSCYLTVQATTACGTSSSTFHIFMKSSSQCGGGCSAPSFVIAPNPAQNNITISLANTQNKNEQISKTSGYSISGIKLVRIYDASGNLVRQQKFNSNNTSKIQMDVSSLISGTYSVVISDGTISETQKVIIQR